jgi:hypothetical protein
MIKAFNGSSMCDDAYTAGREATKKALAEVPGKPDMLWVFASARYDQRKLLEGVASVAAGMPVIGCSSNGEISIPGLSLKAVAVLALVADCIRFHPAQVEHLSKDSYASGARLGEKLQGLDCRYLQIFSDGLGGNADQIIQGMKSRLGDGIKIAGGAAGDGGIFKQTFQYSNDHVLSDSIVAVGFEGDFAFSTSVACGWFPVGVAKKVTRSSGNVVYELDGQPALQVYEKFLGKHANRLPAVGVEYPLGLLGPHEDLEDSSYFLCRATMGVDRKTGSITFAGEVPQGALVKMTMGSETDIIQAVAEAAQSAMEELQGGDPAAAAVKPKVIFMYSCMARKIVLGSKTAEEISAVRKAVGNDVPLIGFYTYGEYAPVGKHGHSHFHNETATMTIIGE